MFTIVPVYAPAHLRSLYFGGMVIDVVTYSVAESFSIETDLGSRFVLRDEEA